MRILGTYSFRSKHDISTVMIALLLLLMLLSLMW
jgi:hypothetical protein